MNPLLIPVFRVLCSVLCRPGGHSGGIPPDPIPNSAVKAPSAHGTAAQAAGESVAARSAKNGTQSTDYRDRNRSLFLIPRILRSVFRQTPPTQDTRKPRERNLVGLFVIRHGAVFARAVDRAILTRIRARFGRSPQAEDDMANREQRSNREKKKPKKDKDNKKPAASNTPFANTNNQAGQTGKK